MPEAMKPFLTAEWRTLAMLNYEVDPDLLRRYVPSGTELDTHNDVLYVSVVGFLFLHTRVLGVPIPFHRNFEEVNLRFYVRRRAADEWRRGVVFIKEIVPRWAIAVVARRLYNENYVALPMRHVIQLPSSKSNMGSAEIGWQTRSRWDTLRVEFEGEPVLPEPGSEAEFITEHYWGYTRQRDGGTIEYQVEHPQWPIWRATRSELTCDIGNVYASRSWNRCWPNPRPRSSRLVQMYASIQASESGTTEAGVAESASTAAPWRILWTIFRESCGDWPIGGFRSRSK